MPVGGIEAVIVGRYHKFELRKIVFDCHAIVFGMVGVLASHEVNFVVLVTNLKQRHDSRGSPLLVS